MLILVRVSITPRASNKNWISVPRGDNCVRFSMMIQGGMGFQANYVVWKMMFQCLSEHVEKEHGLDLWSGTPEYAHRTGIYTISNQE